MTEILLIRHGETDWNVEKRLQGHLDIELNAEGRRQASALGYALREEPLDAIYASDLQRALQTAQAIATPRGMPVLIEPALRERCYGALEGLCYHDISIRYPEAYKAWRARDIDARYPSGRGTAETLREFSQRVVSIITQLANRHLQRRIAVVTHGGVLDCIYRAGTGHLLSAPRDFDIFNASINRIGWNGTQLSILHWGEVSHLALTVLDEVDR